MTKKEPDKEPMFEKKFHALAATVRPGTTFPRLRDDPRPLRKTVWTVVLAGGLYALTAAGFGLAGSVPMAPVFIPIAPENYHFWEMAFVLPLFVSGWLIVSIAARLIGWILGGKGTFRATAASLALAWSIPLLFVWLFETAIAVLMLLGMGQKEFVDLVSAPGTWQTVFLGYLGAGALWLWRLNLRAMASALRLRWWKALLAGTLTTSLFLGLLIVFVR